MKNEYLQVRLSHLIRHCSVGAIVRGPEYLLTVKDIREWTDRTGKVAGDIIYYCERVRSAWGIDKQLRKPPIAKELDNGRIDGVYIPSIRFPQWFRCPTCGLLYYKPWKGLRPDERPHCREQDRSKCKNHPELDQVPWVLVHPRGHMADVPWHRLAHSATKEQHVQCRYDWADPYLRLTEQGSSWWLSCTRKGCNARVLFSVSQKIPFGDNTRQQPWIAEPADDLGDVPGEILEISDARIHSPLNRNALIIPPESRLTGTVTDRLFTNSVLRKQIEDVRNPRARKGIIKQVARDLRCQVSEIEDALHKIENGYPLYGKNFTTGMLLEDEYNALIKKIPDLRDDEDFVTTHHTEKWKSLTANSPEGSGKYRIIRTIDHLVAVNRLKEIAIFEGFRRMAGMDNTDENKLVAPDIIDRSDWLPAVELYGEGIFINIAEQVIGRWEDDPNLKNRALEFLDRFVASGMNFDPDINVSPRFLFLHTLAHLLIRQLEAEAGYPAASLKERIYSSSGKQAMSGILVYVAVPDVAGSLGGLVELATPERFLKLLSSAIDHAEWCSLDPVCSEHEGQGPNLLNRAACHGCVLIPETGCAYGNVLLDRTFIKGEETKGIPPFLDCVR